MDIDYDVVLANSFISCAVLLVWFKTEAVLEYAKLFGLGKIFYEKEYEKFAKTNMFLGYHDFLLKKHNCFVMRLITCPVCLTVWMSVFFALFFGFYYLCPNIIISLSIYFFVLKLMKD
jgi:hypothetical protein